MLFPEVERVIYMKNPLNQVICQIRYPDILKIDTETPTAFQEFVRHEFPLYRERTGVKVQIPPDIAQIIPEEVVDRLRSAGRVYEFLTTDEIWILGLTRGFLSLTNNDYRQWEIFRERLVKPIQALEEVYTPSFASRIGLRYQNLIIRSAIGLEDKSWSELVNPLLAGFLNEPSFADLIDESLHKTQMQLEGIDGRVRLQYGLVKLNETNEICFLIDNDFYVEGEERIENGLNILDEFNRQNHRLFRWCISEILHETLEPEAL